MIQTMGENTVNSQKREIIIMKKKNRQDILSSTKFSNCFAKLFVFECQNFQNIKFNIKNILSGRCLGLLIDKNGN